MDLVHLVMESFSYKMDAIATSQYTEKDLEPTIHDDVSGQEVGAQASGIKNVLSKEDTPLVGGSYTIYSVTLFQEESESDWSSFIRYDDNSWDDCWPPNVDGSGYERDDGNAFYVCKRTDDCWPPNVDGSGDERDDGNACYVCKRTDDCWPPNVDGSKDERDDGIACYVCKRTDDCWPPNVDGSGDERDDGIAFYVCKRTDDCWPPNADGKESDKNGLMKCRMGCPWCYSAEMGCIMYNSKCTWFLAYS
ncbi:hypothetical protein PoB_004373700 [Plakobranchus ocellatus]|uniref:Uncharacterized protein n=1 Tax=Plakobranchus ocellatus TaxID=259542 RepID=A0AAV4BDG7_9GAST|nr:hypothetical protein PoB_004373700 [Plakobranchus ocellatus]